LADLMFIQNDYLTNRSLNANIKP